MSIYPTTPTPAPYNSEGWPAPADWGIVYRNAAGCAGCGEVCVRRESARYTIPGKPYVLARADFGSQDPTPRVEFLYALMRYLDQLDWLASGLVNPASTTPAQAGGNFTESWSVYVSFAAGTTLELSRTQPGFADPIDLLWSTGLAPFSTTVQPGDQIYFNGKAARLMGFPTFTASTATLTLNKGIALAGGDTVEIWRSIPAAWPYMAPHRALFVHKRRKLVTAAEAAAGPIDLTRADASAGRIAWPEVTGIFSVKGDDGVDLTATVLAGFPSASARLVIGRTGGAWFTTLDLSGLGQDLYVVTYCPEVLDQADPGATSPSAWRPTQTMCKHCVRDFSNTFAAGGVVGIEADAGGGHWFCDQLDQVGVLTANFVPGECYQTNCPFFEINTPWIPDTATLGRLVLAHNIFIQQKTVGLPDTEYGRTQNPSIHGLAGIGEGNASTFTGGGLALRTVSWPNDAKYGFIRDVPTAEKEADEGDVKEVKTGSLDEGTTGVLEQAAYGLQDRAGGQSPDNKAQYDDGTNFNDDEGHQPLREQFSIDAQDPGVSAIATGSSEGEVQRARPFPLIFPGITIGTPKTFSNAAITFDGSTMIVTLAPHGGATFAAKTSITATASEVVAWAIQTLGDDTLLEVQFRPDIVTQASASGPTVTTSQFVAAGGTVDPPNHNRIFNPYSAGRNVYGSMARRLARGDSVTFAGIVGFESHLLTCLWSNAFGGDEYTGPPPGDPAVPLTNGPQGPQIPDFYGTQSERLAMDTATLEIRDADLIAYVLANPTPSGVTVAVNNASVLPPVYTAYEVEVRHQVVAVALDTTLAPTYFDPANGVVKIDTTGMDAAAVHCFEVRRKDGAGEAAHVYDRTPTSTAAMIDNLRTAARQLKAFYTGSFLTGVRLSVYDPALAVFGEAHFFYKIPAQTSYTKANTTFFLNDGTTTVSWWITSGTTNWGEGLRMDDAAEQFFTADYPAFILDGHALGRLTAAYIADAIMDMMLTNAQETAYNHDRDESRIPVQLGPVFSILTDPPVRIAAYAIEGAIGTLPFELTSIEFLGYSESFTLAAANVDKWATLNVEEIAQAAANQAPGKSILFAVVAEKTDAAAIATMTDINELAHSVLGEIWEADTSVPSHHLQGNLLTYTAASVRNFGIEIDPDVIENDANTPHIFYNSDGGGHAPAIV